MPAKASLVRRLNFCQWVDAANPAIDGELWRSCEADFDEEDLYGRVCVGGLDLSGTRDLTALARVYEPDDDGIVYAVVELWTPADTLVDRSARDRVPMAQWVDEGFITATPGRSVNYQFVAQRLLELSIERDLRRVAYDPYRITYLERDLQEIGVEIELVQHGQGYGKSSESGLWMPRSVELLEELVASGKLRVLRNPALTYAAASAVHVADAKGNRIYDKRRSTGKIDALVALAEAVGLLLTEGDPEFNVLAAVA
jgi:phage terminase large subunit-like protein